MKSLLGQRSWWLGLAALALYAILGSGCNLFNNDPVIKSLTAERKVVTQTQSTPMACVASDPDGDELTYQWTATGGSFSGQGSNVTWTAPDEPGNSVIFVKVMDGRGGEATMQLTIEVLVNRPPVIEWLRAERTPIRPYEPIPIECIASDPDGDELSYLWAVTGGNISGEGLEVIWIAPDTGGRYFITVVVTDGRGGEASEELFMNLRSPSG